MQFLLGALSLNKFKAVYVDVLLPLAHMYTPTPFQLLNFFFLVRVVLY